MEENKVGSPQILAQDKALYDMCFAKRPKWQVCYYFSLYHVVHASCQNE